MSTFIAKHSSLAKLIEIAKDSSGKLSADAAPTGIKSVNASDIFTNPVYSGEGKMLGFNDRSINSATDEFLHQVGNRFNHYQEPWENFDRYYSVLLDNDELSTNKQYIFIVRPECNLVQELNPKFLTAKCATDPFWQYMHRNHAVVMKNLTMELDSLHDFIPFLVGRTESLQIPDYSIRTSSLIQPYTHYQMPYGGNAIESQSGGSFDITFRDDAQLRVHKLFQAWLYYIDGVSRNKFDPKRKFIDYNKIDYATSVYHFVMDNTGQYIQWWSKFTGCIPTTVPNSDLSWNLRGSYDGRFSVPFQYFHHEALNPHILVDFNRNSTGALTSTTHYDDELRTAGLSYVGAPYVITDGWTGFKLIWRKPKYTYV